VLQIIGSNTNLKEPVVKNSLQFLDITPDLLQIRLIALAAGGHNFTLRALPSSKLWSVALLGCGVNLRLLRKIMLGQTLTCIAYRPGPTQVNAITGSDIVLPQLLATFTDSKLSLEALVIFPSAFKPERASFKIFESVETLEVPLVDVLNIPYIEEDPEVIYGLLKDHLPATLRHIILRYMSSGTQANVIIEQLAVLKMQNILPHLDKATFIFCSNAAPSFVSAATVALGGLFGGLTAAETAWGFCIKDGGDSTGRFRQAVQGRRHLHGGRTDGRVECGLDRDACQKSTRGRMENAGSGLQISSPHVLCR